MSAVVVSAFYAFVEVDDPDELQARLYATAERNEMLGSVLVASEGINGTIAGSREATDALFGELRADTRFAGLTTKESFADFVPFKRLKVKVKPEIVTMRQGVDPTEVVGTYVRPEDWNEVVDDPNVMVIDTRNRDEIELGTFAGAVDPGTDSFTEFADYAATLDPAEHPKIAMFCTGGIRCEKASAYLLDQGFDEVLHLEGGILQYLEDVPEAESRWQGECFVFDDRVSVNHQLAPGTWVTCRGCRWPVSPEGQTDDAFEDGVSCSRCAPDLTDERRAKLRDRHRQELLARSRGERHIGRRG